MSDNNPMFQSTPVIADGRIAAPVPMLPWLAWFQSTPVIADGRIGPDQAPEIEWEEFQSTPVIADGRIVVPKRERDGIVLVSIHARHC